MALNWHHTCFWFWPHRFDIEAEEWLIPPFPNGDYYVLLTDDLTSGIFGHPWEETVCVFGEPLLGILAPRIDIPIVRSRQPTG